MEQPMMGIGEEMPEEGSAGGYCIEIRVSADGKLSVSSEPLSDEDTGENPGTEAGSIGEAIKMAMDIYENDGDMMAGEEDFQSGFGGAMVREGE